MKNLFIYSIGVLLTGVMMTACSPESFDGADPNGIPSVSDVDFSINVDQETNQMIATYTPQPGTYPVWIINGTTYSTLQEVGYQNPEAGSYTIDLKLGNRNGFSQGVVSKSFTFNETKIDYSADFKRLCGKEWRIANREVAHMGCGPAGTDGAGWWSAQPDDKKDFGVYDDRITFTADTRKGGSYTYSAGEDGMTYVNVGTKWGAGADADIDVALGNQTSTWSFEVYDWEDAEGNVTKQTYIQLAANTLFPYISGDAQYENPKFRIEELTAKKMILVYDAPDRSIAWRFVLTNGEDEPDNNDTPSADWDYASGANLWKSVDDGTLFEAFGYWFADDSWTALPTQPEATHNGDVYELTIPEGTGGSQWQGQFHIDTKLTASAAKAYNFYLVMEADSDCPGVTFKLTDAGDSNFFIEERNDVKADVPFVLKREGVTLKEGKDADAIRLFFDFGGAPAGTHIKISKIYFEEDVIINYDDANNLWKGVDEGTVGSEFGYWFADDSWTALPTQPVAKHSGDTYEITLPEGMGGSQWQGQFHIDTKLTASAAKAYHFKMVVEADDDCPGVTIKLTDAGDTNFFCEGRHDIQGGKPFEFVLKGATLKEGKDADAVRLFFDFGGSPAGTNIKISKITLIEAQ
ncbi:hypothetical protein SAMN04487850_1581 [Prevotella aff. ruminicola Tc2-24]|uniref:Uncharacterized protein n=1 Tax=Prevotella aff. ruminicola Tc2-24 TaxID=81582 RepID=A0A1I0P4T7_9BACT|nr:hypothetical protein [Prevotella aff. ruminicola Tc2-24]SEW09078.1 hypothetical protein SAMN04487850_1581 [Prevotella aff. ruminicola Tc2-24]